MKGRNYKLVKGLGVVGGPLHGGESRQKLVLQESRQIGFRGNGENH